LRLQAAFGKKEVRTTKEKEKTKLFTKVKAASYDKIYIASKGSKQERTAAFEVKEEVKLIY
jgi:hypothetical protein